MTELKRGMRVRLISVREAEEAAKRLGLKKPAFVIVGQTGTVCGDPDENGTVEVNFGYHMYVNAAMVEVLEDAPSR